MSWAAKSRFVPHSNSTITIDAPSCEIDVTFFTRFTWLTISSTGRVRSVSTSSGEAPLYVVITDTTG